MLEKMQRGGVGIAIIAFLAFNVVLAVPAHGQVSGATLTGVVADESGSGVPDAKVSIKNVGTGTVREQTTNGDGLYSAPNLLPGTYEVTISAKGFQTTVQKGIELTVGATQALNFGRSEEHTSELQSPVHL